MGILDYNLKEGEPHPMAESAREWFNIFIAKDPQRWARIKESIYSCSIEHNRTAEILASTVYRIENKLPISDRYLLGLVWFLRNNEEGEEITLDKDSII